MPPCWRSGTERQDCRASMCKQLLYFWHSRPMLEERGDRQPRKNINSSYIRLLNIVRGILPAQPHLLPVGYSELLSRETFKCRTLTASKENTLMPAVIAILGPDNYITRRPRGAQHATLRSFTMYWTWPCIREFWNFSGHLRPFCFLKKKT